MAAAKLWLTRRGKAVKRSLEVANEAAATICGKATRRGKAAVTLLFNVPSMRLVSIFRNNATDIMKFICGCRVQ